MMSLLVSFQSAIMILGNPAEIYMYGTQAWLGYCIGFILALTAAERLVIPWMYPLHLTSINEVVNSLYVTLSTLHTWYIALLLVVVFLKTFVFWWWCFSRHSSSSGDVSQGATLLVVVFPFWSYTFISSVCSHTLMYTVYNSLYYTHMLVVI